MSIVIKNNLSKEVKELAVFVNSKCLPKKMPEHLLNPDFFTRKTDNMISQYILMPDIESDIDLQAIQWEIKDIENQDVTSKSIDVALVSHKNSIFLRDSSVSRFDGKQIIPFTPCNIEGEQTQKIFEAIFPNASNQRLLLDIIDAGYTGSGMSHINTAQAKITAYELGIPYKSAKTCIEGGNCFLFMLNGSKKALIGDWSLYLSYYALKEQRYFKSLDQETDVDIIPSPEALRLARNLRLYKDFKKMIRKFHEDPTKIDKDHLLDALELYQHSLAEPLSSEINDDDFIHAKTLEIYLQLTKKRIAKELKIPLKDIIFIPQLEFHIDMEMFITPSGQVVLHDDALTVKFLKRLKKKHRLNALEKENVNSYLTTASKKVVFTQQILQDRIEILEAHGIPFKKLPAVFSNPQINQLNYCNGLFFEKNQPVNKKFFEKYFKFTKHKKFIFLTTGPSTLAENPVHRNFTALFERTFPEFELKTVQGISEFIAKYEGGIRCLTKELYLTQ